MITIKILLCNRVLEFQDQKKKEKYDLSSEVMKCAQEKK